MTSDNEENDAPHLSPFEAIRQMNEDGIEFWSARGLAKILQYDNYRNFLKVVAKARIACEQSGQAITDHFVGADEMVSIGSGAKRKITDVYLSRYACYLIVQNANPEKLIVALGQTYFAAQTRRQELADELAALPDDQLRLVRRSQMSIYNSQLAETAQNAGVILPIDFAIFQDHGYIVGFMVDSKRKIFMHVRDWKKVRRFWITWGATNSQQIFSAPALQNKNLNVSR